MTIIYNAILTIWRRQSIGFGSSYSILTKGVNARVYATTLNADVARKRFGTEVVYTALVEFDVDLLTNDQITGYNPFGLAEEPIYAVRLVFVRGDGPLAHRQATIYQIGRGAGQ